MNLRNLLSGLLVIVLSVMLAPRSYANGLDDTLLNISLREDPVYPVPEIGQRRFYCRYVPTGLHQNQPRMVLRFARQASFLDNTDAGAPYVTEVPPSEMFQNQIAGAYLADYIMPWRKRDPGSNNLTGPAELIPDGQSGFYQWVLEYVAGGSTQRAFGDVHSITMPRRLVFVMMGDSFGSGEGAAAAGSKPWLNTAGHRSPLSGGEIAISLFRQNNKNLAFDYVNTTSSGAIADDIHSSVAQSNREGTDGQGINTPQAKVLENFLGKPEKDFNYNSYKHVDAIIMSCGGNDIGFSTIVTHYFGLPTDLLATSATCLPLLAVPFVGVPLTIACFAVAFEADYSFEEQGHDATYISGGFLAYPDFYFKRLKSQYRQLNQRLVGTGPGGLRAGADPQNKTSVDVNKVLVIEYPNPLKKCTSHWDVTKILGMTLLPLPLHIAEDEAKEVNTKLAVQTLNTPTPSFNGSPGGLNHTLRDAVAQNNGEFGDWQFVQTGHLMSNSGGLCHSGRQFVRRWEAFDMAGPNPENNAIHPNRKGHSEIYAPAISAALQNAVSPAYLQSQASEEGIKPGSTLLPDLVIYWLTVTNFNTSTGQISFNALIRNNGGSASDPGKLKIFIESVDGISFSPKLGEVSVPAIQPNSFAPQTLSFTLTIPDLLAFRPLPTTCYTSGSNFNPAAYETRDRALSYWFIQDSRIRADVSIPSTESNSQNNSRYAVDVSNPGIQTWKVHPAIDPAQLNMVLQDFATHRGLPSATPADIRLTNNIDLAFFGFWDPVQKYIEEKGNIIAITDLVDPDTGIKLNHFAQYRNQNLRNFCTGEQGGYLEAALIPLLEGGINTDGNLGLQPNNDGSATPIGIQFPGIGGQVINQSLDIRTPQIAVGIPNYPPGEPITGQRISFNLDVPAKVAGYRVMAGLAVNRSDFYDSGMVIATSREGTTPPPAVANLQGFPADGRTWFVTVESLLQDGKKLLNVYKYDSQPLNARLLSPDEGVLPDGVAPELRWQPGTAVAEGYRARIGSKPGGWDIFGLDPLDPASEGTGVVSSRTTQMSIPTLPRDGREIFITLETKRAGAWYAESYRSQTPISDEPSLFYPAPGTPLGGRAVIRLRPGDPETREVLVFAGSRPGASDLYTGVVRNPSSEDLIWDFPLPAPEPGMPSVYVTVQSDSDPLRRTQWVFPRSMNATLLTPSPEPFTPLALGDVEFTWQRGNNVAGHMLTVGTTPGGNEIAEYLAEADGRSTTIRIPQSSAGRLLFISLHSIRLDGANGLEEYVIPVTSSNPLYQNDGIDDFMQALLFGPNNLLGTADADFNGNGDSNLIDILAGIDPRKLGERWDRRSEIAPDGRLRFPMPAIRLGTRYQVQRSADLINWEDHGAPVEVESATPDGVIESQRRTGRIKEFYRLMLEPK
jgi:hypothetical protein